MCFPHYWLIEAPAPGQEYCKGICKFCGASGSFHAVFREREKGGYVVESLGTGKIKRARKVK